MLAYAETIKSSKPQFAGFAILIIILSHLVVVDPSLPFVKVFTPGFIGVDIFLFYSGYSLGFSYTKRTTREFYIQRIKRIVPMFLIFAILSSLVHIAKGDQLSIVDWACNLTTLSYYGIGGFAIDWYLSSIFLFYLTYPLLFVFIDKARMGGVILLAFSVLAIITSADLYEYYGCAISRIPIFCLGIWFYQNRESKELNKSFVILSSVFFAIMCIGGILPKFGFYMHGYFLVDMFCPLLLILVSVLIAYTHKFISGGKTEKVVSYIGTHSLEVYIANFLSMGVIGLFIIDNCYSKALIYFVINIALCLLLIPANSFISKLTK